MRLRKKANNNWLVLFKVIGVIGILFIFIWFLSTLTKKNNTQTVSQVQTAKPPETTKKGFYVNDNVSITGTISGSDNIELYTHILIQTGTNDIFGLISKDFDLNNFSGSVLVKGVIVDIKNNIPILQVEQITQNENSLVDTGKQETLNNNSFFNFPQYGFNIDFGSFSGYSITNQEDKISINKVLSGEADPIVIISAFRCQAGSATKDCKSIVEIFKNNGNEYFSMSNGVKVYSLGESDTWFMTNSNLWGYYLNSKQEKNLLEAVKFINLYLVDSIKSKITQNISNICKNEQLQVYSVENINIEFDTYDNLIANISGKDQNQNIVNCKLKITLDQTISTNLIEINKIGKQDNQKQISVGSAIDLKGFGSTGAQNLSGFNTGNYLEYVSKLGFKAYLPKSVSFKHVNISADELGIAGIKCISKINVIQYKQKDLLDTNPGVVVYNCNTSLDENNIKTLLSGTNMIYKKSIENQKTFIIKYQPDHKDIAENIILY